MELAEKTSSADGTPIAFEHFGDGPVLVIVGGAWNTRRSGAELAEALAPNLNVYTYDRRGRGDSGDTPPYAVEREIEDLQAVIEAAGGSAALFGHSSGAALALETTARSVSVSRLAMYEPRTSPTPAGRRSPTITSTASSTWWRPAGGERSSATS